MLLLKLRKPFCDAKFKRFQHTSAFWWIIHNVYDLYKWCTLQWMARLSMNNKIFLPLDASGTLKNPVKMVMVIYILLFVWCLKEVHFILKIVLQWFSNQDQCIFVTAITVHMQEHCYSVFGTFVCVCGWTGLSISLFCLAGSCRRGQSHLPCVCPIDLSFQ